jgi:hypothetical protein
LWHSDRGTEVLGDGKPGGGLGSAAMVARQGVRRAEIDLRLSLFTVCLVAKGKRASVDGTLRLKKQPVESLAGARPPSPLGHASPP